MKKLGVIGPKELTDKYSISDSEKTEVFDLKHGVRDLERKLTLAEKTKYSAVFYTLIGLVFPPVAIWFYFRYKAANEEIEELTKEIDYKKSELKRLGYDLSMLKYDPSIDKKDFDLV